jgi:hypothetical protein
MSLRAATASSMRQQFRDRPENTLPRCNDSKQELIRSGLMFFVKSATATPGMDAKKSKFPVIFPVLRQTSAPGRTTISRGLADIAVIARFRRR